MIKWFLLAIIGISAGGIISAGVFSFLTSIGIINRIASNTHSGKYIRIFEDFLIIGGIAGGVCNIFDWNLRLGTGMAVLYGIFSGTFVGCIAGALAETLNATAVFARRIKLQRGLRAIVYGIAFGKLTGSILYFFQI